MEAAPAGLSDLVLRNDFDASAVSVNDKCLVFVGIGSRWIRRVHALRFSVQCSVCSLPRRVIYPECYTLERSLIVQLLETHICDLS